MTPERLQELIDERGAVWTSINGGYWFKLNPKQYKIVVTDKHPYYDDGTVLLCYKKFKEPSGYDIDYELTDLREDINRALWERDVTAEQVVKFNPPMWEDIEKGYDFYFNSKEYSDTSSMPCGLFSVVKGKIVDSREKPSYDNCILVRNISHYPNIITFYASATKENYIKACEIVGDLFKGEK